MFHAITIYTFASKTIIQLIQLSKEKLKPKSSINKQLKDGA